MEEQRAQGFNGSFDTGTINPIQEQRRYSSKNEMEDIPIILNKGSHPMTKFQRTACTIVTCSIFIVIAIVLCVLLLSGNNNTIKPTNNDAQESGKHYTLWCIGNCHVDVSPQTNPGAVLMGGGTDVESAFQWQIANANGGDFLVLRTSGTDAYNPWIYNLSHFVFHTPLNSVTTILFNDSRASYDPLVLSRIRNAEAIFFAGGDQSLYVTWWSNTPLQSLLNEKIKKVTVGGTSAGCAILGGGGIFSALKGSITSHQAMSDPYSPLITLQRGFLHIPFLENYITDTHFVVRNRMGRMLTFLARLIVDNNGGDNANVNDRIRSQSSSLSSSSSSSSSSSLSSSSLLMTKRAIAIGIDQATAILLNTTTGKAQIVGNNTAYICHSNSSNQPHICQPGKPLTFWNIQCIRLTSGLSGEIDLIKLNGTGLIVPYCQNITRGHINDNHYGPFFVGPFLQPKNPFEWGEFYAYSYGEEVAPKDYVYNYTLCFA